VPPRALMEKLSGADFQFMAAQLNKAGELAKKSGLKVGYHNHFWEFKQLPDMKGTGYDILLKETEASLVSLELDIFWAEKSGIDPVTLFKQHPGRFTMWHVKDIDKSAPGSIVGPEEDKKPMMEMMKNIKFAEVGTGVVDFKKIFANASEAGVKYAFVEQDQITIDPFVSIRKSYDYVKNNLLIK
jgi:sugar phosphate isomerase/epimerase